MLFCIVTFNIWLHYNKLLTYLLTYLLRGVSRTVREFHILWSVVTLLIKL